jgi:hypothetical protein
MRRLLPALIGACALAGALLASSAGADPGNAKGASQIHATCGTRTVNVVVNGNGKFTPAHVVGSTSVFVPTKLDLTFSFTPTGGTATTNTQTATKTSNGKLGTVTCTIPLQTLFSSPQGTGTISGTVMGFFTPR